MKLCITLKITFLEKVPSTSTGITHDLTDEDNCNLDPEIPVENLANGSAEAKKTLGTNSASTSGNPSSKNLENVTEKEPSQGITIDIPSGSISYIFLFIYNFIYKNLKI